MLHVSGVRGRTARREKKKRRRRRMVVIAPGEREGEMRLVWGKI